MGSMIQADVSVAALGKVLGKGPGLSPEGKPVPGAVQGSAEGARMEAVREGAIAFEAVFLAEMLNHAGVGKTREAFGGGAGEDAFGSLMTTEWADMIARQGGIGVAEWIVASLSTGVEAGGSDV